MLTDRTLAEICAKYMCLFSRHLKKYAASRFNNDCHTLFFKRQFCFRWTRTIRSHWYTLSGNILHCIYASSLRYLTSHVSLCRGKKKSRFIQSGLEIFAKYPKCILVLFSLIWSYHKKTRKENTFVFLLFILCAFFYMCYKLIFCNFQHCFKEILKQCYFIAEKKHKEVLAVVIDLKLLSIFSKSWTQVLYMEF